MFEKRKVIGILFLWGVNHTDFITIVWISVSAEPATLPRALPTGLSQPELVRHHHLCTRVPRTAVGPAASWRCAMLRRRTMDATATAQHRDE